MKVTILLRNDEIIEYYIDQVIKTEQMPYMAVGYGFNGSSEAKQADLDIYWNIVDQIFTELELDTQDYYTLLSLGMPVICTVIAGGGGGSPGTNISFGNNGFNGEILEKELSIPFGVPYTITIGAGGPGGYVPYNKGTIGSNSKIDKTASKGGNGGEGTGTTSVYGPGKINTGQGGSGGAYNNNGFNGGSGIITLKYRNIYPTASNVVGYPNYTDDGEFHIYQFDNLGSITW